MLFYLNSLFAELALFFVSIVFNVILIFIWLIQSDNSIFNKKHFFISSLFLKSFLSGNSQFVAYGTPSSLPFELFNV